ncbi:MAG: hypothetical protein H6Q58_2325 [Firmicutes bacterium]|nr:hypothetical protein [Bacillota bacterium]
MQRKHIIYAAVAVALMAAVFAGAYVLTDMGMKGNRGGTSQTGNNTSGTADASPGNVDEQDIVKEIHLMSNSLIEAEDGLKWGEENVDKTNIDKVIRMLDQAPVNTKTKKLRQIVERWQQGDFSQIVDDHNFVWDLLGGTVGRASSADSGAVAEAVEELKKAAQ